MNRKASSSRYDVGAASLLAKFHVFLLMLLVPNDQKHSPLIYQRYSSDKIVPRSGGILLSEAFAQPNGDFLLGIDGASIGAASEHMCVLEQRNAEGTIGGRAVCWGYGGYGQIDSPKDVSCSTSVMKASAYND